MAYLDPIDPTTPADPSDASLGDDRIRELKRALRERLLTFFNDLELEPLNAYFGRVVRGHEQGDEDVDPAFTLGALWQDPRDGRLYVGTGVGRLEVTSGGGVLTGTIANRPNPPTSAFYWATDENSLSYNESGAWVSVNRPPLKSRYGYLNAAHITNAALFGSVSGDSWYVALVNPGATSATFYIKPVTTIGTKLRRFRLWSFSKTTGGSFGLVRATLLRFDRDAPLATTIVSQLDNQDGDAVYKQKESADLNLTLAADEELVIVVRIETFVNNVLNDAIFGYAEIEREEGLV